jgi:hypothetical protein
MSNDAATLARRLASQAEAVCAHYLSNGRRQGRFWQVGDVMNTPGQSLYVRLAGPLSGPGAAGKWTDSATAEHGDLLDLIGLNRGLTSLKDVLAEARLFLALPPTRSGPPLPALRNSPLAAQRLFAASRPVPGTLAATYLRTRCITCGLDLPALRFHPRCYCRDGGRLVQFPALIVAVTDLAGNVTAVQRTWLAADGRGKAPLPEPRKSLGNVLGNAVRFGVARDVLAAGEGVETMLALRSLLPEMPMLAANSAAHLAAIALPTGLRRLYVARDNDAAGFRAAARLVARAQDALIDARPLVPTADDWNTDLIVDGPEVTLAWLLPQLAPDDRPLSWSRSALSSSPT